MKRLLFCLSISFGLSSALQAQTSHIITYQGAISSTNGAAITDSIYPIAVTLWTDSVGGTALWRDVFETPVRNGVFNIALGGGKPLPAPAEMDRPLWLGVSFNGEEAGGGTETGARSQLGSVPTALNVADSSITTAKLADHSVTWNKMGTEYVPYIRVNGLRVNTGNSSINFTGGEGLRVDFDSSSLSVVIRPDSSMAEIGSGKGSKAQAIVDNCGLTNKDGPAGNHNFVGSGCTNVIVSPTGGNVIDFSTITGGQTNTITNQTTNGTNPTWEATPWHFIGGGESNSIVIDVTTEAAQGGLGAEAIVGGVGNTLQAPFSFIGGGQANHISSQWPTNDDNNAATIEWDGIGAGNSNSIDTFTSYSFIGGGRGITLLGILRTRCMRITLSLAEETTTALWLPTVRRSPVVMLMSIPSTMGS